MVAIANTKNISTQINVTSQHKHQLFSLYNINVEILIERGVKENGYRAF